MKKTQIIGSLLAMAGGASWGLSGTVAQFLFTQKGISALWITPIRMFGSGVILVLFYLIKNPKLALSPWHTRQDRRELLIYGLAGIALCQMLYFVTIQLSSAGVATILQDLAPIMILICACVSDKRRPFGNEIVSIVLALVGVFLIVTHGNLSDLAVSPSALMVGILCAVTVTIYNVYPKRLLTVFPVPLLQGWSFLLGGSIYMVTLHPWTWCVVIDTQIVAGILCVMFLGNIIAFNFYMKGVAMVGPDIACLYGFAEPITAAVLSCLWMGSSFTLWDGLGFICVFLMLVLLSMRQWNKKIEK